MIKTWHNFTNLEYKSCYGDVSHGALSSWMVEIRVTWFKLIQTSQIIMDDIKQDATNWTLLECMVEKYNYRIKRATGVRCRTPAEKKVYCRHWRSPHATFIQQFVLLRTLPDSYRFLSDVLNQIYNLYTQQSLISL